MDKEKKGFVLWFTGLSGAGKTTLADRVFEELQKENVNIERLDGDIARQNLTKGLGFSREDREENIRRIGFVAELLRRNGVIVVASFITPYSSQRQNLKEQIGEYIEIFVDAPLEVCEQRDPKGMYEMARKGEIVDFTGVSHPYEAPSSPDIIIKSHELSVDESLNKVISFLKDRGLL